MISFKSWLHGERGKPVIHEMYYMGRNIELHENKGVGKVKNNEKKKKKNIRKKEMKFCSCRMLFLVLSNLWSNLQT